MDNKIKLIMICLAFFPFEGKTQTYDVEFTNILYDQKYFCGSDFDANGYIKSGAKGINFGEAAWGGSYNMKKEGCNDVYHWDTSSPISYNVSGNGILSYQNSGGGFAMVVDPKVSISTGSKELNYEVSFQWTQISTCPYDPPLKTYNYHGTFKMHIFQPPKPTISASPNPAPVNSNVLLSSSVSNAQGQTYWGISSCKSELNKVYIQNNGVSGSSFNHYLSQTKFFKAFAFVQHPQTTSRVCETDLTDNLCVIAQPRQPNTPPCSSNSTIVQTYDTNSSDFYSDIFENTICNKEDYSPTDRCNCNSGLVYQKMINSIDLNAPKAEDLQIHQPFEAGGKGKNAQKVIAKAGGFLAKHLSQAFFEMINPPTGTPGCGVTTIPGVFNFSLTTMANYGIKKSKIPNLPYAGPWMNEWLTGSATYTTGQIKGQEIVFFRDEGSMTTFIFSTSNNILHPYMIKRTIKDYCDKVTVTTEIKGYSNSLLKYLNTADNAGLFSSIYRLAYYNLDNRFKDGF